MYKRKRAGNTITRKINSTKDTAAKADKNHYISNSYLEGFIPIDTEYFTASSSFEKTKEKLYANLHRVFLFPVHLTQVGIFAIFFMPLCHYFLSFFFFPSGGFSCRSCSAISSIICFFRYTSKASSQIKEKS